MKHTPGPWYTAATSTIGHAYVVDSEGFTICDPSPMGAANARLIAAAPDLLAALQMVARIWSHDQTANAAPDSPLAIVRAAITKATGDKHETA